MKGIQFVVDDSGEKQAVIIDLREWGEVWEDFYDILLARARQAEPTIPWDDVRSATLP